MTKKDALLVAAKELFGKYGYAETTFKKISEQAGVALGLLAHHYGTKEKLFLTAGMDVLEHMYAYIDSKTHKGKTGLDKVMLFCRAYLDFSVMEGSHYLFVIRCSPYNLTSKEDRSAFLKGFTVFYNRLETLIRLGIEDGTINASIPAATSEVLVSVLLGGCRTHLLTPFAPPTLYTDILAFIHRAIASTSYPERVHHEITA